MCFGGIRRQYLSRNDTRPRFHSVNAARVRKTLNVILLANLALELGGIDKRAFPLSLR